jgi:hypothetical protein
MNIYLSITFETRKYARWFFCWLMTTFKILMSSLFRNLDETSFYRLRWVLIKTIFIYFTNSTKIRKYVFTLTINWTRTIEMSNTLRSTFTHWKWKSTISMTIRARYIFIMCTIFRSFFIRHETIRLHFRRRNDFWLMRSRIILFCLKILIFIISFKVTRRNRRSIRQRMSF